MDPVGKMKQKKNKDRTIGKEFFSNSLFIVIYWKYCYESSG